MLEPASASPHQALSCASESLLSEAGIEQYAHGASLGLGFTATELFAALCSRVDACPRDAMW